MGYLRADNRVSGGILAEADTTHCRHCQAVIVLPLRSGMTMIPVEDGGKCSRCGPICGACAKKAIGDGVCEPWKKKVDASLNARARRQTQCW